MPPATLASGSAARSVKTPLSDLPTLDRLESDTTCSTFHAEDKVTKTWSRKHSCFKEAARVLAETVLVPDVEDKRRMQDYIMRVNAETLTGLRAQGAESSYFALTYAKLKRKAPDWLRRRVKSFAPPRERMVRDLREFARAYGDVVCVKTKKKLFTHESWKKMESLLEDAEAGWLSDPPDVSLYTILGYDKEGFPIHHCSRGSVGPEAIHRIVRQKYRALRRERPTSPTRVWLGGGTSTT